jgi:hypothetical protein
MSSASLQPDAMPCDPREPISKSQWIASQKEQTRKWAINHAARASANAADDGAGWVLLICDTLQDHPATTVFLEAYSLRFQICWVQTHPGAYIRRALDCNPRTRPLLVIGAPKCVNACHLVVQSFTAGDGPSRINKDGWFVTSTDCAMKVVDRVKAVVLATDPFGCAVVPVHQISQNRRAHERAAAGEKETEFDLDDGMPEC